MSQSLHLFRLQQVDRQLDQIQKRAIEIDQITSNNSAVRKAEDPLAKIEQQHRELIAEIKNVEDSISVKKIKIEQSEAALYGGKVINPKELQNLQIEISILKKNISQLEDDLLKKMIELEQIELLQIKSTTDLDQVKANFSTKNAGLLGEKSSNQIRHENLINERKAIIDQIDKVHIEIYEKMRNKKKGVAVSEIIDTVCSVCGSELSPAEWQAARNSASFVYCSSCGRILYAA
jgi:predicted  nucleic acid-binding Zn-ribbon protein